ncbi:Hypothetical protein FKW44_006567, partial [Caligus rogercresseyi]
MEEEKRHARFAPSVRIPKEVIEFFNYPKSTEMGCSKQTTANTINKGLGYSSYKKRHRMILTGGQESRRVKAAALLNNLKHETA